MLWMGLWRRGIAGAAGSVDCGGNVEDQRLRCRQRWGGPTHVDRNARSVPTVPQAWHRFIDKPARTATSSAEAEDLGDGLLAELDAEFGK